MATRAYQGNKIRGETIDRTSDELTMEEALQINVNGAPLTITMRTPGDDKNLVRGLLHSENVIKSIAYDPIMEMSNEGENGGISIIDVEIAEDFLNSNYSNSRSFLSVSSCGICGKTELEEISSLGASLNDQTMLSTNTIHSNFKAMSHHQKDFAKSGGCHAAAAFDSSGKMLSIMEDIGRHNAVDKVVGQLISEKQLKEAHCLLVSGRISYEIVIKCFKAKIPILAAVSAPSTLAVDYAKELGLTLIGFCREDRLTCYANSQRISFKNDTFNAS